MKKSIIFSLVLCVGFITLGVDAGVYEPYYTPEFQEAYLWAKNNGITTMDTIEGARMNYGITREEMAKMISNYAKNILGKEPDTTKKCYFLDSNINPDLVNSVTESCQLGLMGQGVTSFRPKDSVTRAEFGTVLSRLLYGNKYEGGTPYYKNHLQALKDAGIMTNISTPENSEMRGYVMIMMQRSELLSTGDNQKSIDENTGNKNSGLITVKVDHVVDGDTISVLLSGEKVSVRLIGVDTPEKTTKRYGYKECYGEDSSEYLTNLLDGKTVKLEYDETQGQYDVYDRLLAYVLLNGENINEKIIKNGYGREYTYNKPYKYQSEFKDAQEYAEKNNKGLWSPSTCNGERISLEETITTQTTGNIKGNINNKGEKIYHAPGCSHYEKTVITESKGEKRFSTTKEAEDAGWRACIE